jgi:hypothetical protein
MTFAGSMARQCQKPFAAAMTTFSATLLRGKALVAAATAMSATLNKHTNRTLNAVSTAMAATIMRGRKFAAAILAMDATLNKQTDRALDAVTTAFSVVFSSTHAVLIDLTAGLASFAATISKQIDKFFNAS